MLRSGVLSEAVKHGGQRDFQNHSDCIWMICVFLHSC